MSGFDPCFIQNVDSSILDNICETLDCGRSDISGIVLFSRSRSFAFLIIDVLGKRLDLTGRYEIWDQVLSPVESRDFLIGRGVSAHESLTVNGAHTFFSHSMYLEIWLLGGLAAAVLMLLF